MVQGMGRLLPTQGHHFLCSPRVGSVNDERAVKRHQQGIWVGRQQGLKLLQAFFPTPRTAPQIPLGFLDR